FNIPSEWNGIYNVMTQNETLIFGEFSGEESTFLVNFGLEAEGCDQINEIYGCTDAEAINFNPEATIDDGSCEYDFECGISFEVIADSLGENMFYIIPSGNIVNASSVLWDFGDGSTSTEFYPTHIYESDGPFTLCLFVTFEDNIGNYCEISYCEVLDGTLFGGPGVLSGGFMINVIPTDALSNDSSIAKTEISVYPNPTNDMATISYLSDRSEKLTLRIFDLTGKVLEQQVLSSSIGKQKIQVDLSEFPQGLYLIGLEQNESRTYAKVVRR
ncbi:MAG TPA: T9SS type A sorting domain-containing protein, partial [Cryomorphaceae bacterium]|nr:T9SS type A sorting domain-containing protein [Cryomorphaceae bacterium]